MGNLKRYLLGIYHAVGVDKLARYLTAFAWRLNHWYDLLQVTQYGLSCTKAIRLLTLKSLRHMLCVFNASNKRYVCGKQIIRIVVMLHFVVLVGR